MNRAVYRTEWEKASGSDGADVVALISTTSPDRQGDVVLPSGMRSSSYSQNPVVLLQHNHDMPIGKGVGLRTRTNGVEAGIKFAERPSTHPEQAEWMPDTVKSLMQQGVLNGFSIGFTVPNGGWRDATEKDIDKFGAGVHRVITEWELLEFSVVSVPANAEALAMAVAKGHVPNGPTVRALGYEPRPFVVRGGASEAPVPLRLTSPPPLRVR